MTAEIVVFNTEGIAMATDSAVTSSLGDIDKISSSANKLFSLSDKYPVGIMVYGNSSFMGMPLETIIKVYRSKYLPSSGFQTLNEYARDFVSFLCYKNINFSKFAEVNYVMYFASEILFGIRSTILDTLKHSEDTDVDEDDLSRVVKKVIDNESVLQTDSEYISVEQSKIVFKKFNRELKNQINAVFNGLPLDNRYRLKLRNLLMETFSKFVLNSVCSGVVFAGFGESEFLPMVKAYRIEGIVRLRQDDKDIEILKYVEDEEKSSSDEIKSAVIPYAQQEMVNRFMEGVDPDYLEAEQEFITDLCKDYASKVVSQLDRYNDNEKRRILQKLSRYSSRMTKEFMGTMAEFKETYFWRPTIQAVGRLSKNELASMAEALVYLTSLKRKVSSESETVSEPVDVAMISKGDGFVWIKRKHYFDPKLNPVYFMKRNLEVTDGYDERTEVSTQPNT